MAGAVTLDHIQHGPASGNILPIYLKNNISWLLFVQNRQYIAVSFCKKLCEKLTKTLQKIGNTIRVSRERAGLTQEELAELGHVSVRTIRDLESGRGNIGIRSLSQLTQVLGLTIDFKPSV
ncbi:helix-turn-helix domain-containing protein [Hymenobacter antarcticus]|uniref:helix-turn-helix domain-containing protein n=1 Tax=Hymenobacter antarcticus TaxID=486270 RepID=UPI003CD0886B